MKKLKTGPKRGRPVVGRKPLTCYVHSSTREKIESLVDHGREEMNTLGKVVESRFTSVD